ncbi:MAG: hypothetical protein LRY55_03990 [Leadbetterella sp.]|nr:hypothetical protein [Leadbetterella sp.]
MKKILTVLSIFQIISCTRSEEINKAQYLAVCSEGGGCEFSEITLAADEVDKLLGKTNFWVSASSEATLVLESCESKIEEEKTLNEIHQDHGGKGEAVIVPQADIAKLIRENACFACPNTTKKITFYLRGEGFSGNGYFFLNLRAGEAFMPNEAFQQLYAGGEGYDQLIIDQFMRNSQLEQYLFVEGKKYVNKMAIGTDISAIKEDALNEQRFKNDFKKTGKRRSHLNTNRYEEKYAGKDDEGTPITFWITPAEDVCLPYGKFDAWGFYNLGYISVDGVTYLVTEISGAEFEIRLTGISEGSYEFNTEGYQPY